MNDINQNDIENIELEKKSLAFILEIAKSYSISTTKLKKMEIIEKIKAVAKRKREYQEEQNQKANVNSFNKIIKLTIVDNIEPIEILFWKVFRNKPIYRTIFSFMDQRFSLSYDSISSIPNLIISNHFSILKEKVYRNCRYLQFDLKSGHQSGINYLKRLFENIKDDYKFYRNFFKKDNHYYESQENISFALILSKNLQIYKLYIKEFNYEPTKVDLLFSIISGSNKFIKYLFELNPPPISELDPKCLIENIFTNIFLEGKQDQIKRSRKEAFLSIKKDDIFKGLLCYLNIINNNDDDDFSCSLNYNENDLYEINENSTLKRLITICIFLIKTKTSSTPDEKESFKSVPTIQEIENFKEKVGKERLKSILQDPINYNYKRDDNNEIKNFIKKLLYFYFSTFKKTSSILYYCYFDDIDPTLTNFILPQPSIEFAFRFGNFKILESFKTIDFYQILPTIRFDPSYSESNYNNNDDDDDDDDSTDECYKILFSHCLDKEKKVEFINQIIKRFNKKTVKDCWLFFFYMLVIHNDIELLKYYYSNGKVGVVTQLFCVKNSPIVAPIYYINSIDMLEYLFNNHINFFKETRINGNRYSTNFKNLELLKHFELLLTQPKSNSTSSSSSSSSQNHFPDGHFCFISHSINSFEFLKNKNLLTFANYFASNSKYHDEKLDYEQLFVLITNAKPSSSSSSSSQPSISFETLRDFTINSMKYKRKNLFFTKASVRSTKYTYHYLKFIDWMFINYNQEKENACNFFYKGFYHYHNLFATHRYCSNNNDINDTNNFSFNNSDSNNNNNNNDIEGNKHFVIERLEKSTLLTNGLTPYLYEINNLKFLNWFLTMIKTYYYLSSIDDTEKKTIKTIVESFMNLIIHKSRLQVLEIIHQNFDFILKKESNGGMLDIKTLKSYLFTSLGHGSINVSKFLFQFINITKKEFEKNSNQQSLLFFSNKFNK
ncbi:hypothetical protein ACTFIR_006239 [Dictyostelium discoideum]